MFGIFGDIQSDIVSAELAGNFWSSFSGIFCDIFSDSVSGISSGDFVQHFL